MQELPIFPLNVVVFPGMPMPLHIFEPRYKQMINECIREKRPFGIVLIQEGRAEGDANVIPCLTGCTVQISQVERLDDGRLYIMTYGKDRFRIRKLERGKRPYLLGQVELLQLASDDVDDERADALRQLMIDYLALLDKSGDMQLDPLQLPTEPEPLIYVAASMLNVDNDKKQQLLESNHLGTLLNYLHSKYQREISMLKMMPQNEWGVFSPN